MMLNPSRLGAVIDSEGSVTYPWYCDAPIIGVWFNNAESCRVPTQAELDALAKASIDKAAGAGTPNYNPDLSTQQYQGYKQDVTALCNTDPAGCAAYKAASNNPTCAAFLGTGDTATAFCANPGKYLLIGGAVIAGLIYLGARR